MERHNSQCTSLLASSFLFCGLNSQDIQELAQKATIYSYPPGQILIEEGLKSERILYIIDGLVKIYKLTPEGKEIFIAVEKSGNYLGLMDTNDEPGSATIETLQTTKLLIFYKKDLRELLKKYPQLWEKMYQIVLAKLNEYRELQSLLLGNNLYERTYLLLQHLSQFSTNKTVPLSQETIASMVNATRARVSQTVNELQKNKKIIIASKRITVLG